MDAHELSDEELTSVRAILDEPPPLIALAERHAGRTALAEYLASLEDGRIALVEEIDRVRSELAADQAMEERSASDAASQTRYGEERPRL